MSSLSGKEILVIDDAPEMRLIVRKVLEGDGAKVIEAESVAVGLNLAKTSIPHLIISDLIMPDETGFDLLEKCRRSEVLRAVPVLVLSGKKDAPSIYRAISLGASDYLLKPFRSTLLLQKVKKQLRSTSFRSFTFPKKERPQVFATVSAQLLMVNESGFILASPFRLGGEQDVKIKSPFLERLNISDVRTRTTTLSGRFSGPSRYTSELNFIGLSNEVAKSIRSLLKGSW